jgi:hypothetical protein
MLACLKLVALPVTTVPEGDGETVSVAVEVAPFAKFTVAGCTLHEYLIGRFPPHESVTGLALLLAGTTLICRVPDCPAVIVKGALGTLRLKSGMLTLIHTVVEPSV